MSSYMLDRVICCVLTIALVCGTPRDTGVRYTHTGDTRHLFDHHAVPDVPWSPAITSDFQASVTLCVNPPFLTHVCYLQRR